ncbi:hydantoinase/oxoprolinase family protein [Humitalea rosea]|nr:hydantoinase/oxoprolinase family protein [Humitalea rosea]
MSSTEPRPLLVAVDIGGTFTDVTLQDTATGQAWMAKTPSTPHDPSEAFLAGVLLALEGAGRGASGIGRVLHGTTVATNLILEGRTARTALVTTTGFRHVLEIGRADLPRRDNLWAWIKPKRPVPPEHVFEVAGRIAADGSELTPLDEAAIPAIAARIRAMGAEAVAICFLHAFANPGHEQRALALLRASLPDLAVTASTEVLPVVREYERSMAAVLNAAVMPAVSTYLGRLEARLAEAGIAAPLLLMKSNGGVAGSAAIRRAPAQTALSGPAAGVVGARAAAEAAGVQNLITVDIGGTSADICLIAEGRIGLTQSGRVGPWPLPLPMLDMVTIGAGGGSIARIGAGGALTVGPQSAGAAPGPACYGRGGTEPTVTDAHLYLGHLTPALLGGRMALDPALAEAALARVATPLGLSLEDAARGILAIADNNMVGAIRVVSVERGHDPRGFVLVPFGGAGPLHGAALARLLGIRSVMVPQAPGVLCAQGLAAADLRAEFSRSIARPLATATTEEIEQGFSRLEAEAAAWFADEAVAEADRGGARVALMRYAEQGFELPIPWAGLAGLGEAFAAAHRALYGFDLPGIAVEIVTLRLTATGALHGAPQPRPTGGDAEAARIGTQPMRLPGGIATVPVLDRARLGAGARFAGPAIVTQLDATTLVPPGWDAMIEPTGVMMLHARD